METAYIFSLKSADGILESKGASGRGKEFIWGKIFQLPLSERKVAFVQCRRAIDGDELMSNEQLAHWYGCSVNNIHQINHRLGKRYELREAIFNSLRS